MGIREFCVKRDEIDSALLLHQVPASIKYRSLLAGGINQLETL